MNKQKYNIVIIPSFGCSRFVLREQKVIIPSAEYDVYCNGEFYKHFLTEDSLRNGLSIIEKIAPKSQELNIVIDNKNINSLKF